MTRHFIRQLPRFGLVRRARSKLYEPGIISAV